ELAVPLGLADAVAPRDRIAEQDDAEDSGRLRAGLGVAKPARVEPHLAGELPARQRPVRPRPPAPAQLGVVLEEVGRLRARLAAPVDLDGRHGHDPQQRLDEENGQQEADPEPYDHPHGGPSRGPPKPPDARGTPAKPWRPS